MTRRDRFGAHWALLAAVLVFAGCNVGPAVNGSFDRTLDVNTPIRLDLTNASGDVTIAGSSDGKVHVHGDIRVSGFLMESPEKRLRELVSNPPIEQKPAFIRIGKDFARLHNVSITYSIQVPQQTEINSTLASGSQTISDVRGPVKAEAASGSIDVQEIDRSVQVSTASGSVNIQNIGDDVRVSSASGSVTVSNVKGDVRVHALSGYIRVTNPGGRVDADTASGSVEVRGATTDVTAHDVSGRLAIQGNPGANGYWDLHTTSGSVELAVPPSANFHLSAEAVSGDIQTDIPIVIEEQGKHSLRAHLGNGGGRVEVHTVSGSIRIRGGS